MYISQWLHMKAIVDDWLRNCIVLLKYTLPLDGDGGCYVNINQSWATSRLLYNRFLSFCTCSW